MASFNPVQQPTETPKLTNLNQTIQGAEHPIAKQFVENVIKTAMRNIKLRQDRQRFREQRAEFDLHPTILDASLMDEQRNMRLGGIRSANILFLD
tara:strand:- start:13 stop:297 length:285 start_codon:yes stop_codon:yes gene_type:complete